MAPAQPAPVVSHAQPASPVTVACVEGETTLFFVGSCPAPAVPPKTVSCQVGETTLFYVGACPTLPPAYGKV